MGSLVRGTITREYDLWLKAYDTSLQESEADTELYNNGYVFECCACIIAVGGGFGEVVCRLDPYDEDAGAWFGYRYDYDHETAYWIKEYEVKE